jgi:FMN phosphatase YigB (HAD superfamily)
MAAAPADPVATTAAAGEPVASSGAAVTAPAEEPGPAPAGEPVTAPAPGSAGEELPAEEPPAEPRAGEPAEEAAATPAGEPAEEAEPARKLRLVVLDVMGVVFESGSETEDLLVRFAADKGSPADRETVLRQYRRAAEGRITVGELWSSLGLSEDPGDLSDEFLTAHRLRPGVRDFLERMRGRQLPVVCVANDVAEWSRKLRLTHRLDPVTTAWLVSGDVGERMPGGALYGRVIQTTGIESRDAFFISDRRGHLDTARSFGFAAAWFRPDGPGEGEESPYPVITSFADLGVS